MATSTVARRLSGRNTCLLLGSGKDGMAAGGAGLDSLRRFGLEKIGIWGSKSRTAGLGVELG